MNPTPPIAPPPPAASSINRRQLTHAEVFNLLTWITSNKERLLNTDDVLICAEATMALEIPGLKESHIQGARKTLGMQRRKPAPPGGDLEALECLVNEQSDKLVSLMGLVQGLLDRVRKLETTR